VRSTRRGGSFARLTPSAHNDDDNDDNSDGEVDEHDDDNDADAHDNVSSEWFDVPTLRVPRKRRRFVCSVLVVGLLSHYTASSFNERAVRDDDAHREALVVRLRRNESVAADAAAEGLSGARVCVTVTGVNCVHVIVARAGGSANEDDNAMTTATMMMMAADRARGVAPRARPPNSVTTSSATVSKRAVAAAGIERAAGAETVQAFAVRRFVAAIAAHAHTLDDSDVCARRRRAATTMLARVYGLVRGALACCVPSAAYEAVRVR
jgi:hypothetical protein